MHKIKMIGLDLDGTLLNEKKEITPYTEHVLKKVIEQGVHVVISTGRPITGVPEFLLKIPGMRYVLTSNGGRIIDNETGNVLFERSVEKETALKVLNIVSEYDTLREIYYDGRGYAQKDELAQVERFVSSPPVANYILSTRTPVDNIWDKIESMGERGLDKIHALFAHSEDVSDARARLQELDIEVSGSIGSNLETNAKGVHKGNGLLELGKLLGIEKEEIMACGDGGNDLEMLRAVGFGVAMENAMEEVKAVADYITCSNEDDGVAKAIEKFVLNKRSAV